MYIYICKHIYKYMMWVCTQVGRELSVSLFEIEKISNIILYSLLSAKNSLTPILLNTKNVDFTGQTDL